MIKAKRLLTIAGCIAAFTSSAQYNQPQSKIWAMGNKVGLDFTNPANPVPITTALNNSNEAAASVCDSNGALLFYTNGSLVWDKNGNVMPNGSNLTGTGTTATWSTTQGAVIVPDPASKTKYYLFSLTSQLYVNRIDMTMNNGLGDVDLTFPLRGQGLSDTLLTEKMTAVPGCNNSVWLMVHHQGSHMFRAYHITASGINTTPVLSNVGNYAAANYMQGVIKFSPDRTKLLSCNFRATAPANAGVEVFSFDYTTGALSNAISISDSSFYGGSFSPNSTKVYAGSTPKSAIYQWDLSAANPAASKTILGPSGQYTDMKIGPDGKIYFGAAPGGAGYSQYRFMGRINAPDSAGFACGFKDSVTSLFFPAATGIYGALAQGMPNDVAVPAASMNQYIASLDTTICSFFQSYTLTAPAGYGHMSWDNGDTAFTRTVTARGTYWVASTSACNTRVDTFVIRGGDMPALNITAFGASLTATAGFNTYQWYLNGTVISGATNANYTATAAGLYKVFADYGGGCSDTATYDIPVSTAVGLNNNSALRVYPNPSATTVNIDYAEAVNVSLRSLDGKEVLQANAVRRFDVSNFAAGVYLLQITDSKQQIIHRQMFMIKK